MEGRLITVVSWAIFKKRTGCLWKAPLTGTRIGGYMVDNAQFWSIFIKAITY